MLNDYALLLDNNFSSKRLQELSVRVFGVFSQSGNLGFGLPEQGPPPQNSHNIFAINVLKMHRFAPPHCNFFPGTCTSTGVLTFKHFSERI